MVGVVIFVVSVVTASPDPRSSRTSNSQWIAVNAKDAVNAIGLGGFSTS